MYKKILFAFIGMFILSAISFAAVPGKINFQGVLKDSSGNLLTGSYSIEFSIYAGATGGSAVWTETQTVAVSSGIYNVLLGSATAVTSTVFDGTTKYLGVKVGSDSEMTPRIALVTVPYAFRAATADNVTSEASTLGGRTGDDYIKFGLDDSITEGQNTLKKYGAYILTGHASGVGGVFGGQIAGLVGGTIGTGAGPNFGGRFTALGTEGIGVQGLATNTGVVTNYGGSFEASGANGVGLYAYGPSIGGSFNSGSGSGRGVYIAALGSGSTGLFIDCGNDSSYGIDVQFPTTGSGTGISSYVSSTTTNAKAIYGRANSSSSGYGVYARHNNEGSNSGSALYVDGKIRVSGPCGSGTITSGNSEVTVSNTAVSGSSLIFLTIGPSSSDGVKALKVVSQLADTSFVVRTVDGTAAPVSGIPFSYWIIN